MSNNNLFISPFNSYAYNIFMLDLGREVFTWLLSSSVLISLSMETEKACLAGGCFWGVEELLRKLKGIQNTVVGYTGGHTQNPTYEEVKTGTTGHAEAIEITYQPELISFEEILLFFFRMHNPTTINQQGNDKGSQYRSAIFYYNSEQEKIATKVREEVNSSGKWANKIVTEIVPASVFYNAEEYHQDYLQKNPNGYTCHYVRD